MEPLVLPLPPNELRVNGRFGWSWTALHEHVMSYREDCRLLIKANKPEKPTRFPVHLTIQVFLAKGQRIDASDVGSFAKVPIDALKTMNVLPDDGSKYINPFTVKVSRDRKNPRLEITWE